MPCRLGEFGLILRSTIAVVPDRGLEPPHPCGHQLLRLACLPIPPIRPVAHRRDRMGDACGRVERLDRPPRFYRIRPGDQAASGYAARCTRCSSGFRIRRSMGVLALRHRGEMPGSWISGHEKRLNTQGANRFSGDSIARAGKNSRVRRKSLEGPVIRPLVHRWIESRHGVPPDKTNRRTTGYGDR